MRCQQAAGRRREESQGSEGSKGKVVPKKAKVSVLTAEEKEAEAAVPPATESAAVSEAPAAALNSVEQVRPYQFNPERYQDYRMENSGWWSVEAVKPIQTKRVWAKMEAVSLGPALGHYIFDNVSKVWKSAPPPSHAAKCVHVEIYRGSYTGSGMRKPLKVTRKPLDSWCFPDSGAQVTLINPGLVKALGGDGLIQSGTLQIKDAGGHIMDTTGCIFIVISKRNEKIGIVTKTHQQAYISEKVEDIVISREAMESLRFVSDLNDRKRASVRLVSSTVMHPYYSASLSPRQSSPVGGKSSSPGAGREECPASGSSLRSSRIESSRAELESTSVKERHRSVGPVRGRASVHSTQQVTSDLPAGGAPAEFIQYTESDRVHGGQVTLNIVAMHNVDFPLNKVTLSDLKPSYDPEFKCRGSLPLKNGILTCGCFVRAEAPDPTSYRDVAGFDGMSRESLII